MMPFFCLNKKSKKLSSQKTIVFRIYSNIYSNLAQRLLIASLFRWGTLHSKIECKSIANLLYLRRVLGNESPRSAGERSFGL